ncbi:hypothetical protein STAFG_7438 [Streptomyces afghaniensis 772]|uniref:Uncharacterized protein n=1 Tax=Streptomyces afghaniensis 772 TaxID=1283301 RepID=S4NBM7_9ACTN|nr:hypothetical protein STAFG_7438 [Streptomyces afghaniensis 772]
MRVRASGGRESWGPARGRQGRGGCPPSSAGTYP